VNKVGSHSPGFVQVAARPGRQLFEGLSDSIKDWKLLYFFVRPAFSSFTFPTLWPAALFKPCSRRAVPSDDAVLGGEFLKGFGPYSVKYWSRVRAMAKRGLLPEGAATVGSLRYPSFLFFSYLATFRLGVPHGFSLLFAGPYDSDSSSSDEAAEPTPEMADRAEKMRRRLTQRTSGTAAASSSQSSPAPRPTPPPPRNVVDLTPSPVVSPTRQPPPPQTESPSSKRPAGQTDEPAPKRIRLCHEVEEDAQIWMGASSVRKWCANVLLPKDVEATHALGDGYILEASLRQSYRVSVSHLTSPSSFPFIA
jgi:hypothetical protein